jgi:hypothetical protein
MQRMGFGGGDRALDVFARGRGDAGDDLAGVRVDDLDRLRGAGLLPPGQDQIVLNDRAHGITFGLVE